MKKLGLLMVLTVMICAFFAVPSFAATKGANEILGSTVLNAQGQPIGRVYDLIVQNGEVQYAIINEKGNLVRVPYADLTVKEGNLYAKTKPAAVGKLPQYAQPMPSGKLPKGGAQATVEATHQVNDLIGRTVLTKNNEQLGRVYDVVLNGNKIEYVVIDHNNLLTPIPYSYLKENKEGNLYVNAETTKVAKAPSFKKTAPPYVQDPNWKQQWFGYWRPQVD